MKQSVEIIAEIWVRAWELQVVQSFIRQTAQSWI